MNRTRAAKLGTIDYLDKSKRIVFQRHQLESPCVLQIGTCSAELALQCALLAYQDYDALDVNMGCPKHFSVHSGMGAALLREPERIKQVCDMDNLLNLPLFSVDFNYTRKECAPEAHYMQNSSVG